MLALALPLQPHRPGQNPGAFQISHAFTWLLGGIFLYTVGTRLGLALGAVFWSAMNLFTGIASWVSSFAAFRFLLTLAC